MEYTKFNLLSVDACRIEAGWAWNQWFTVENDIFILESEQTPRKIFKLLRKMGVLTEQSKGKLMLDDDGYNLTICLKSNQQPILALCYGEHWEFNGL